MLKRLGIALLAAAFAYAAAFVAGYFIVMQLSTNSHDRELEAAMTAAFAIAPAAALVAFAAVAARRRRRSRAG